MSSHPTPGLDSFEHHEGSAWLRHRLHGLLTDLRAGRATGCPHHPGGVAFAALWRPGVICCTGCLRDVLGVTGEADRTCDRCAQVVDVIHPDMVAVGGLFVMLGLCPACQHREVGR